MKTLRIAVISLLVAAAAFTQSPYTTGTSHQYFVGVLSTSPTAVIGGTVYVSNISVINNSSSPVTVTIKDRGTDCSGGPCALIPVAVSIAANTSYFFPFKDDVAPGGVTASASDGTNVTLRIHYRTSMQIQ